VVRKIKIVCIRFETQVAIISGAREEIRKKEKWEGSEVLGVKVT
jgi:hypothetical protein